MERDHAEGPSKSTPQAARPRPALRLLPANSLDAQEWDWQDSESRLRQLHAHADADAPSDSHPLNGQYADETIRSHHSRLFDDGPGILRLFIWHSNQTGVASCLRPVSLAGCKDRLLTSQGLPFPSHYACDVASYKRLCQ